MSFITKPVEVRGGAGGFATVVDVTVADPDAEVVTNMLAALKDAGIAREDNWSGNTLTLYATTPHTIGEIHDAILQTAAAHTQAGVELEKMLAPLTAAGA